MQKREEMILQRINILGNVSVAALAADFSVSVETIRRDLNSLAQRGLIYRTHGGAAGVKARDIGRSFQTRQRTNAEIKRMITLNAIDYVFEGSVIGLDASSTSWHFAQQIPDIPCTVVTNSMHNITALVNKPNIRTIATGGVYSSKYDAFYGPLSEKLLERLHIDIGICSCTGIDSQGKIWESNEVNASLKRKMLDASGQKILIADSSKFEKKNLILLGELSQMDVISTDKPLPYELEKYCHEYDILVLTA
ncbi:DeoR/GlpR family DNA-binding transcription regulator [Actinobacillus porcinus]|uniref:DeoR/GlpR family DNA-binding transcription regulator n=1 Tax=Actinobacillus porcinus TaxID=51048 RepID=UPI002353E1EE|nr:DeoR/GlpR family DNA-binding transcription regulator [Actinobacillus porcinus]